MFFFSRVRICFIFLITVCLKIHFSFTPAKYAVPRKFRLSHKDPTDITSLKTVVFVDVLIVVISLLYFLGLVFKRRKL